VVPTATAIGFGALLVALSAPVAAVAWQIRGRLDHINSKLDSNHDGIEDLRQLLEDHLNNHPGPGPVTTLVHKR